MSIIQGIFMTVQAFHVSLSLDSLDLLNARKCHTLDREWVQKMNQLKGNHLFFFNFLCKRIINNTQCVSHNLFHLNLKMVLLIINGRRIFVLIQIIHALSLLNRFWANLSSRFNALVSVSKPTFCTMSLFLCFFQMLGLNIFAWIDFP